MRGGERPRETPLNETVFLKPGEVNALADEIRRPYRPMVLLAAYRGLRFGELAGLRPRRLNLLHGRLEVAEALKETTREQYFGLPKYERVRMVPLPPFLVEVLEEHLREFAPQSDLVFTSPEGKMLRRSLFERRIFTPAVVRAALDTGLTFHGLRHTAVSILISQGATLVELAAIMGWSRSTAAAMAMRYGHLFAERERHLTEAVERLYRETRRPTDGLEGSEGPGRSGEKGR